MIAKVIPGFEAMAQIDAHEAGIPDRRPDVPRADVPDAQRQGAVRARRADAASPPRRTEPASSSAADDDPLGRPVQHGRLRRGGHLPRPGPARRDPDARRRHRAARPDDRSEASPSAARSATMHGILVRDFDIRPGNAAMYCPRPTSSCRTTSTRSRRRRRSSRCWLTVEAEKPGAGQRRTAISSRSNSPASDIRRSLRPERCPARSPASPKKPGFLCLLGIEY